MIKVYGIIFIVGLIIQITTSVTWVNFSEEVGYIYFMVGQAMGELCYMFCIRQLFKNSGLFRAVVDYAVSLIIIDIFTVVFLNPFEVSISKYAGFIAAGVVLLFRINKYK